MVLIQKRVHNGGVNEKRPCNSCLIPTGYKKINAFLFLSSDAESGETKVELNKVSTSIPFYGVPDLAEVLGKREREYSCPSWWKLFIFIFSFGSSPGNILL